MERQKESGEDGENGGDAERGREGGGIESGRKK